jgi:hypothetical protein
MRRASQLLLIPLAVITPLSGRVEAQSAQAISLQVSGLYNGVFGNVFDGLQDGFGGEAQIRYTPGALSLGVGFQYTSHGLDIYTESARLYGGFFEPRYRIHTGSNVLAPYISARFSVLKMGFSGGDLSVSSNFIQLNGGGGLLYRVAPRINLDMGATYGYDRLGSGTFSSERNGPITTFPARSGSNVVVRLGFAMGIGG